MGEANGKRPHALLRAGFPYLTTLGMRRVTTFCMDLAIGDEGRLYVLCRNDLPNPFAGSNNIRRMNWDGEDLGTIGSTGSGDGAFIWPACLVRDRAENLYVSDEGLHRISAFSGEGDFLGKWGTQGSGPGELNRPSGLAFDAEENLYVADTLNHRIQKFTKDGKFLDQWGRQGAGEGEFNMPWGLTVDADGDVYVADWRNDRVQKLSPDGAFITQFGRSGDGDGEFNRPSGVAVDADGDIYVADRGNNRVQLFDRGGRFVEKFLGDATLSKMGRDYIMANPKVLRLREMVSLEPTKRLRSPTSVRVDAEGRLYVVDFASHRIQVYKKEAYPLAEDEVMPAPPAPMLMTV